MLKIIIQGEIGAGKTTLARLIEQTLLEHGLNVSIENLDEPRSFEYNDQRVVALKNKNTPIEIQMQQVQRRIQ